MFSGSEPTTTVQRHRECAIAVEIEDLVGVILGGGVLPLRAAGKNLLLLFHFL